MIKVRSLTLSQAGGDVPFQFHAVSRTEYFKRGSRWKFLDRQAGHTSFRKVIFFWMAVGWCCEENFWLRLGNPGSNHYLVKELNRSVKLVISLSLCLTYLKGVL